VLLQALPGLARGEAERGAVRPDGVGHGPRHLHHQAGTVRGGAAVGVVPVVGGGGEELLQEVAVGTVDLHAVEAGVDRPAGRIGELGDDAPHLVRRQRPGRGVGAGGAVRQATLATHREGGRRDDPTLLGVREHGDATAVHELHGDAPAGLVDGVGDLAPPGHVLVRGEARLVQVGA